MCEKALFSFIMSIHSQCCVPAFLAAQRTTVCLDDYINVDNYSMS